MSRVCVLLGVAAYMPPFLSMWVHCIGQFVNIDCHINLQVQYTKSPCFSRFSSGVRLETAQRLVDALNGECSAQGNVVPRLVSCDIQCSYSAIDIKCLGLYGISLSHCHHNSVVYM